MAEVLRRQLAIGHPRSLLEPRGPAKVVDDLARLVGRHCVSLVRAILALYFTITLRGPIVAFFANLWWSWRKGA